MRWKWRPVNFVMVGMTSGQRANVGELALVAARMTAAQWIVVVPGFGMDAV